MGAIGPGDIMAATLTSGQLEGTVGQLMQTQLVTYTHETSAREICEFLCRAAVPQVFVVEGTQPLGVIRRANCVRWLSRAMQTPEWGRIEGLAKTPSLQKADERTLAPGLA